MEFLATCFAIFLMLTGFAFWVGLAAVQLLETWGDVRDQREIDKLVKNAHNHSVRQ